MSREELWTGFYFHYHGDQDFLLSKLVHPLVCELARRRWIDAFFFVRYSLGGPHVRLRLRLHAQHVDHVRMLIIASADEFFAKHPATTVVSYEEILRLNKIILDSEPFEHDVGVVPSPNVVERVFEPEAERYGGAVLLPASLEAFVLSSVRALHFISAYGHEPVARRLPRILRQQVSEALGFARNPRTFITLLATTFEPRASMAKGILARAEQVFMGQREAFIRVLREEVAALSAGTSRAPTHAAEASRALCSAIEAAPLEARIRIATSHLHMSANRFGLDNASEMYLGRIAWLAANELSVADAALWSLLEAWWSRQEPDGAAWLRASALDALSTLASVPRSIAGCGSPPERSL